MVDAKVAPADTVDAKVLLSVLAQVKAGDFTARMPLEWTGVPGKVADGLNHVIAANQALGTELARVSRVVGKQGETLTTSRARRVDPELVWQRRIRE